MINAYLYRLSADDQVFALVTDIEHKGGDGLRAVFGSPWPFYRLGHTRDIAPVIADVESIADLPPVGLEIKNGKTFIV